MEQAMAENTRMLWVWMAWIRRPYHGRTAQTRRTEFAWIWELAKVVKMDGNTAIGGQGEMETWRLGDVATSRRWTNR